MRTETDKTSRTLRRSGDVGERKVLHTEVRGLHACKEVRGKFGAHQFKVMDEHAPRRTTLKERTVKADHPR